VNRSTVAVTAVAVVITAVAVVITVALGTDQADTEVLIKVPGGDGAVMPVVAIGGGMAGVTLGRGTVPLKSPLPATPMPTATKKVFVLVMDIVHEKRWI